MVDSIFLKWTRKFNGPKADHEGFHHYVEMPYMPSVIILMQLPPPVIYFTIKQQLHREN